MSDAAYSHVESALESLHLAVEELQKAHLESDSGAMKDDIARAMFHMGSAYGVLHRRDKELDGLARSMFQVGKQEKK